MQSDVVISYCKLWKLLVEKDINKTQLHEMAHISTNAVAKMGRNEPVSLDTIGKICYFLKCDIGDVMEIIIDIDKGGV